MFSRYSRGPPSSLLSDKFPLSGFRRIGGSEDFVCQGGDWAFHWLPSGFWQFPLGQRWFLPRALRFFSSTVRLGYWHSLNGLSSVHSVRATDKARKSVITHWKLVKMHWKNKQGVKIHISISRYTLGVQSSAYWLAKLKFWIDNVHLSVHLSTYCQSFPLHYNECMVSDWEGKGPCAIVPLTWKMAHKSLCRVIRNGPLKISKSLKKAENGPFGKNLFPITAWYYKN